MIKILMHGYQGTMGRVVCKLCEADLNCEIVAGVDRESNISSVPFPTYTDIDDCDMPADVIIDFTTASATNKLLAYAKEKKIPVVLCTTGISKETEDIINEVSNHIAIFKSFNMSLGINLVASLLQKAVGVLADFDIEIVEKHHNQKIDAPSGTALLLADAINEAANNKYEYVCDRSKERKKRSENEIGLHSIRGGTIVGEHSVIFAGSNEVIEITHHALSKEVFAAGSIRAAKFLAGKEPRLYNMSDLVERS